MYIYIYTYSNCIYNTSANYLLDTHFASALLVGLGMADLQFTQFCQSVRFTDWRHIFIPALGQRASREFQWLRLRRLPQPRQTLEAIDRHVLRWCFFVPVFLVTVAMWKMKDWNGSWQWWTAFADNESFWRKIQKSLSIINWLVYIYIVYSTTTRSPKIRGFECFFSNFYVFFPSLIIWKIKVLERCIVFGDVNP